MVKGEQFDVPVPEQLNLGEFFLDVNLEAGRGDKTALYYEGGTYSFLELWRLTNKFGNLLRSLGVEPENRVLLILEDSPEWVAAWLATLKVGGVGTHAYTYLPPHDYQYLINLVRPKLVIADQATLARVREAGRGLKYPKALLVAGDGDFDLREGEFSLAELLPSAGDTLEVEPTHRDDISYWSFSGGTTGKPKGVPHRNGDAVVSFASFDSFLGYTLDDIVFRVPKLFFHYARDNGLLFALRSGAASVLAAEKTSAALVFDIFRKYRPTVMLNVPTMMRAMLETPEEERADLSSLKRNYSSGEVLSPQLLGQWLESFGGEVIDRLGSAESGVGYLCNRPGAVVPGSSGTVCPLNEVKLVDEAGQEVPEGQPGLLMTRSEATALYYVREHEKTKTTFPGGGWINTGDLFTRDENGYFWHVGRANDMVKVSGVWVSPLEIEHGLQDYPGVKECAAMAVKDLDGLMSIKAFVVLNEDVAISSEMPAALQKFCKQTLAPHKFPQAVEFMAELPKTGQGKIDRRVLRGGAG
ncbi:MAG: benzoate-CoA ligase family protein [Rhodospirillales bacterium]|jgi:benzoate-CoA ligase|nr:benzoate-CoA ligase family protein [Rhodospirillales bacterium]MDP6644683.1 benzoate-CoA ligase family protein [Rhodospirillales bacterium]MDP6842538.1 benzoate-CoA ligase family protein [Rhodospirillales bacterium]|tara:strand:- start:190 stop:1770 length:1581 start_codon:yes stop_codon:yes gene_type:complete